MVGSAQLNRRLYYSLKNSAKEMKISCEILKLQWMNLERLNKV